MDANAPIKKLKLKGQLASTEWSSQKIKIKNIKKNLKMKKWYIYILKIKKKL
jgi:hypothetical protein